MKPVTVLPLRPGIEHLPGAELGLFGVEDDPIGVEPKDEGAEYEQTPVWALLLLLETKSGKLDPK